MHLSNLISIALLANGIFAADCSLPGNFPSTLKAGMSFPLVTKSATSADRSLFTSITGNIVILNACSLQLTGLTLANAPDTANIQLYGMTATQSFPISATILSGTYTNAVGPVFQLLDTSYFQVSSTSPGVSFNDFQSITVYSVAKLWVIATATLSNGVQGSVPSTSSSNATTGATAKTSQNTASSSASGLSIAVAAITVLFAIAASINI